MEEEKKDKAFVVKDRRLFDESGSVRKEKEEAARAGQEEKPEEHDDEQEEAEAAAETSSGPLPEINFASFIFSLSTTAMYHFGDFPDPVSKKSQRNLAAAKQTIDILNILKAKTEGNLDENEKTLLSDILYELQMRFVKEMSQK